MSYTTRQLLKAQADGAQIVPVWGSARGRDGRVLAAQHSPARKADRKPWRIGMLRYRSCELTIEPRT